MDKIKAKLENLKTERDEALERADASEGKVKEAVAQAESVSLGRIGEFGEHRLCQVSSHRRILQYGGALSRLTPYLSGYAQVVWFLPKHYLLQRRCPYNGAKHIKGPMHARLTPVHVLQVGRVYAA